MKNLISKKTIFIILIIILAIRVFSDLADQDVNSFSQIQEESFTKLPIDQVIVSDSRLYVCYDDVELVNVYDMNGVFLWCIDAPSMRNCKFQLLDGMLVVYNYSTALAYTYDAQTGEYLGVVAANKLELSHEYGSKPPAVEDLTFGQIGWDAFNVYRMEADGPVKLVSRPWWYYLTHPTLTWAIAFFSGLAIFTIQVIIKFRREEDTEDLPPNVKKRAIFFKGFAFACGANVLLNILIIPFYPIYILASFALTAVLILWSIIDMAYSFIVNRGFLYTASEHPYVEKWLHADFVALAFSILSAVALLMLTN